MEHIPLTTITLFTNTLINEKIKLSPYHKIFYDEWKRNPGNNNCNIVFDQTLSFTINLAKLEHALERLVNDYILLNSHIEENSNNAYWVKNAFISKINYLEDNCSEDKLMKYVSLPFDLAKGSLYRFAIFLTKEKTYRFIIVLHHILIDGASGDIFISEVSKYYNDSGYKTRYSIEKQVDLINYAIDELSDKLQSNLINSQSYWQKILLNVKPININFLKVNHLSASNPSIKVEEIRFEFKEEILINLQKIKRIYKISPYFYGQMILAILLFRYTGQEKFAISYPVAIKSQLPLIYGAGINTNIFPYNINQRTTLGEIINYVTSIIPEITDEINAYYPISEIAALGEQGLMNVFFAQTNLKDTRFKFDDVEVLQINHSFNIDLVGELFFEQEIKGKQINYRVRYNENQTCKTILHSFVNSYKKIFIDVLSDLIGNVRESLLISYPILQEEEYLRLINGGTQEEIAQTSTKMLHELFEEQVNSTPDSIAVKGKNTLLTYSLLNTKANLLANYLINTYEITNNSFIALYLDRTEYTIIAILAVLKAGAAYVPIEPLCPSDRVSYILKDTQAKVILTNLCYKHKLDEFLSSHNNFEIDILAIDSPQLGGDKLNQHRPTNFVNKSSHNSFAYVIYTSGTTGKPKGVIQSHLNIVQLFDSSDKVFKFTSKDVWTLFHSYAFDFTVWEIWGALLYGGKLIIPSIEEVKDFEKFYLLCMEEEVTVLNLTPSAFYQFRDTALIHKNDQLKSLRYVILGGEALNFRQLTTWFKCYTDRKPILVNMYGITEGAVHVTYKMVSKEDLKKGSNIGKPLTGKKVYVLGENLEILPLGAIGELYIGGVGLAIKYLNNPDLTEAKFIPNPFQSKPEKLIGFNSRIYKTGDLVRMLPDGNLEYIGRNDSQVKIRGYRIELSEIENIIVNYPGIKQAIVLLHEHKDINNNLLSYNFLVGYYLGDYEIKEVDILDYLSTVLPEYMTPTTLIQINKIPLTVNGKLDISSLPTPQLTDNYSAPNNYLEQTICNAYAEILQLPKYQVGINHDFFKLGGNSILAIRLAAKLQENFRITVNDIFKLKTPGKLAKIATFVKDNLHHQLEQVKLMHNKLAHPNAEDEQIAYLKQQDYLSQIREIKFTIQQKPIKNVLLTGATGYLGCNILYNLLTSTTYNIFLPIRGETNYHALERLVHKFNFYFDEDINNYLDRLNIFASDIEQPSLGLNTTLYDYLIENVDSIIHTAALVKHYGDYSIMRRANVVATKNLLELSKRTNLKDFHYISTIGIFMDGYVPNCSYYLFTENDSSTILSGQDNFYIQTKYEAELITTKYRDYGVNSNIYRIGNLSMHSKNYKNQENIEENAFFVRVKTLLNLGVLPQELSKAEISPVDCAALAVVKLFDQVSLINQTYHLFNPNTADLFKLLKLQNNINLSSVCLEEFISIILLRLSHSSDNEEIELFMLHLNWLQNINPNNVTRINILQDKTNHILSELGFNWPIVSGEMLSNVINLSFKRK